MLILATDMARHSEILEAFKAKLDNFDFTSVDHLNSVSILYSIYLYSIVFRELFFAWGRSLLEFLTFLRNFLWG